MPRLVAWSVFLARLWANGPRGGNIEYDNLQTLAKHFNVNWIWLRYGDDAMVSLVSAVPVVGCAVL